MNQPNLWSRLKAARIVQVFLVYAGASWGILQVVDVLQDSLALPPWLAPVCVILLLVGLVIILATAWIQSQPLTSEREERGEVPSDWEIAPRELVGTLAAGKLPHLTWGRSLLGGAVALSLLFGASGLFVLLQKGGPTLGPAEAGASDLADGIAVVPFDVRGGTDLEIWREGMMDLLTNNLDGVGGYRTIDARTVMARWRSTVGDDPTPDLRAALQAAGATGARYAVSGSVVGLGENVRLVANLYDLDTGKEVAQGRAEGAAADVLRLADDLAVETMRALFQATGREGGDITAETITTSSLPALRAFLEGERHYRRGQFAEAVQEYERAVAADTAFAIALIRLSEGYGWLESTGSERMVEMGERAMAHAERLSPRYQFVMEAWDALNHGSADGVEVLLEAVQKYPDDPEAWFLLAETYIHIGDATYSDSKDIMRALEKAVSLDPDFAPYLIHVAEEAFIQGDVERARATVERYLGLTGDRQGVEHVELAIPIYHGDSLEAVAAADELRRSNPQLAPVLNGTFGTKVDQFDRTNLLYPALEAAFGNNQDAFRLYTAGSQGALTRGSRHLDSLSLSPAVRGIYLGHVNWLWGYVPEGPEEASFRPEMCMEPSLSSTCLILVGSAFARLGRDADLRTAIRILREEMQRRREADPEADVAFLKDAADLLQSYGELQRGSFASARQGLFPLRTRPGSAGTYARIAMGEMEAAQGRTEEAIRHFRSSQRGFQRPQAVLELARLSELAGRPQEAREYWKRFLVLTRGGDPDLPQVREAREALERLAN